MVSYGDRLNDTFKLFETNPPASSTQLIMLHLLHMHNAQGNTGSVVVTDRELMSRTNLSQKTVTEAKRTLKNLGLLDFKTDKRTFARKTTYFFPDRVVQGVVQQVVQAQAQAGLVCYTPHADEAAAAVGAKGFPPTPPFPKSKQQQQHAGARGERDGDEHEAVASAIPLRSSFANEFDKLIEQWSESPCFCKLDFQLISELELLAKEHGVATLLKAMEQAKRSQTQGVNIRYFKRTLESITAVAGKPLTVEAKPMLNEYQAKGESELDTLSIFANDDL